MKNLSRLQLPLLLPLWLGLLAAYTAQGQTSINDIRSSETNFIYSPPSGSYRYAFKADNGFAGQQSADARNEVHGYNSYFEQEMTPYKVKYNAGTKGFRPQVLTTAYKNMPARISLRWISKGSDDLMKTATKQSKRFVKNALKMMQSQPMQISFNSQHNFLKDKSTSRTYMQPTKEMSTQNVFQTIKPLQFSYEEKQNFVNTEGKFSSTSQQRFMDKSKKLKLSKKQFVHEALEAMQRQPMQISFNSQHGSIKSSLPLNSAQVTTSFGMMPKSNLPLPTILKMPMQQVLQPRQHKLNSPQEVATTSGSTAGSAAQPQSHNFVQNAMQIMRQQPIQLSFNSQNGLIKGRKYSKFTPPITVTDPEDMKEIVQKKYPYNFAYNSDNSAHSESSDNVGNVRGQYSYYDEAGFHDLAYKADSDGFVVLGGNLVNKNQ